MRVEPIGGLSRAESAERLAAARVLAIERLREALVGVAERELPHDPLPCYCVRYDGDSHDEWCDDARRALAATIDDTHWVGMVDALLDQEAVS